MATSNGQAMQSLQAHMEDMRSLTLCKICLRPFYEPFILGCGHSFCYSCLRSWFGGANDRRKNKNCPDCRTNVNAQPAPNYLLREISHLFLSRAELLPEDESVAEHMKDQDEESELLSKDRNGQGLFQGVFKIPHFPPMMTGPIHDLEDHVDRCPVCAWEIEDGRCNRCGLTLGDVTDFSETDSELSGLSEMDEDDDSESESDEDGAAHNPLMPYPHFHAIDIDEDEEVDDNSEPNEYDRQDDFIDNEDELDLDGIDMPGDYDNYATGAATPYSDEETTDSEIFTHGILSPSTHRVLDSDEESVSTNPEPYVPHAIRTNRRQIVISDDEDENEDSGSPRGFSQPSSEPSVDTRPFMMSDLNDADTNEDRSDEDSTSDDGESSSDSASESSGSEPDSDSSDATIGDNAADEGDNAAEESDDTVIPPQPKIGRQNRLQVHRNNRDRRSLGGSANGDIVRGRLRAARADGSTRSNRRGRLTSVH